MKQREFLEITLPQRVAPDFLVPAESVLPKPAGWIHLENYPVPPAVPKRPPGPPPLRPRPPSSKPPPHLIAQGLAARRPAAPENAAPENARDQAQRLPMQQTEAPVQEADEQTEASFSEVSDADTPRNDDADAEARTATAAGNLVNVTFASSVQEQALQAMQRQSEMTMQHAQQMAQSFSLIHSIQQQQMQMMQSAASFWTLSQQPQISPLPVANLAPIPPAFPPAVPPFRPQPVYPVGGSSSTWMPPTPDAGSPFIGGSVLPTAMPGRATFMGPGSVLGALPKERAPKPPPAKPSPPKPSPDDPDADDQQLSSDPYGGGEVRVEAPRHRIPIKRAPQAARRQWKPAPKARCSAAAPVAAAEAAATAPAAEAAASALAPSAAATAAAAPATDASPAAPATSSTFPGQQTPVSVVTLDSNSTGDRATGDATGDATLREQEQPNDKVS